MLADYHPETNLVVQFLDDEGRDPRPTNAPVPDGAVLQRVRVVTRWPDPYRDDLPQLLGPAAVAWDDERGVLERTFPLAEFGPDSVRQGLQLVLDGWARLILGLTDWCIVRRLETGVPIPPLVGQHRHEVRNWHADRSSDLHAATPAELLAFDVSAPQHLLEAANAPTLAQVQTVAESEAVTARPAS